MKVEITERRLIDLSDGRTMSLHPGVIECADDLAKELLDKGFIRKPAPAKKQPIIKDEKTEAE